MRFLGASVRCGNIGGNTTGPFLLVARRGEPLPPIALFRVRLEPPVDLGHHRHVAVPELSRDQLEGRAGPRCGWYLLAAQPYSDAHSDGFEDMNLSAEVGETSITGTLNGSGFINSTITLNRP